MFDEIYLESDEEVTSAVEKIKKSKKKNIALCLPRNASLGQSIVNLKLIFKQAANEGKTVALVSPDPVTRSLAERIGFSVAETPGRASFPKGSEKEENTKKTSDESEEMVEPLARKRFDKKEKEDSNEESHSGVEEESPETETTASGMDRSDAEQEEELVQAEEKEPEKLEPKPPMPEDKKASPAGMIPSRGNLRYYRQTKKRNWVIPLIIGVVLAVSGLVGVALALPSAQVIATVVAQPFNETVPTTVDTEVKAVDIEKGILPGKLVTLEHKTKLSAKATGKKDLGQKASGKVTITNEWDSLVHVYPAGTRLQAKNGNQYVTTEEVSVPGAISTLSAGKSVVIPGTKEVSVEAAAAGEAYNSAATTFTLPSIPKNQQEKIYGTSTEAMAGGTSNIVTVVTQADIDKVTENAKTLNKDEAVKKLKENTENGIVIDKAIQNTNQSAESSVAADTQADAVEVAVTGNFQVITFAEAEHKQLLEKVLANKIPQGQQLVTSGDNVTFDTSQLELNLLAEKKIELTNNIKAFTVTQFDENTIRRSLIGSGKGDSREIINRIVPTQKVEATVSPSWFPRLPFMSKKINLQFTYVAKETE